MVNNAAIFFMITIA